MPRGKGRKRSKKGRSSKPGASSAASSSSSLKSGADTTTTTAASDTGEKIVVREGGPVRKQKEEDWFIGLDFGSSSIKVAVASKSGSTGSSETGASAARNSGDALQFPGIAKVRSKGPCSESWKLLCDAASQTSNGLGQRMAMQENGTNTVRIQQDSGGHRTIDNSMTVLSNHFASGTTSSKKSAPPLDSAVRPHMFESVIGYESLLAWPRNSKSSVCLVKDLLLLQTDDDENENESSSSLSSKFQQWIDDTAKPLGIRSSLRIGIPTVIINKHQSSDDQKKSVQQQQQQQQHEQEPSQQITFELDCNPPYIEPEDGEDPIYDDETEEEEFKDDQRQVGLDFVLESIVTKLFHMLSSQLHSRKLHVVFTVPNVASQKYCDSIRQALQSSGFNVVQSIKDHCCAALSVFHHGCNDPRMDQIIADLMIVNNEEEKKHESGMMMMSVCSVRTAVLDFGNAKSSFTMFDACKNQDQEWWQFGRVQCFNESTNKVSGLSFDLVLLHFLVREFEKKNRGMKIDEFATKSRLKLKHLISQMKSKVCEALDCRESHSNITFYGESLMDGIDLDLRVSAAKLDSHFYDYFKWAEEWIAQCGAHVTSSKPDLIIVTGGTLAMMQRRLFPMIRRAFGLSEEWRVVVPGNGTLLGNVTGAALQSRMIQRCLFQVSPVIYQEYCKEQF